MLHVTFNYCVTYNTSTAIFPFAQSEVKDLHKPVHEKATPTVPSKVYNAASTTKQSQESLWIIKALIFMHYTKINNNRKSTAACLHFPRDLFKETTSQTQTNRQRNTHTHKIQFPFSLSRCIRREYLSRVPKNSETKLEKENNLLFTAKVYFYNPRYNELINVFIKVYLGFWSTEWIRIDRDSIRMTVYMDSCFVTKNKIISFIKKNCPSLSHFHDVTKYITESQIREMKKTRTSELVTSDPADIARVFKNWLPLIQSI